MATGSPKFDFVPTDEAPKFDFTPDEPKLDFEPETPASNAPQFDFVPEESLEVQGPQPDSAYYAGRATAGAMQLIDLMGVPGQLDWSAVAEKNDQERLAKILELNTQADQLEAQDPNQKWDTNSPSNKLRRETFYLQQQMSPGTEASGFAQSIEQQQRQSSAQALAEEGRPRETFKVSPFGAAGTPAEALAAFMGPGLSAQIGPTVESAAQNVLPAAAGAASAASYLLPGGGVARFLAPMVAGLVGSQLGGLAQETVLESTETFEETEQRQQRAAAAAKAHPVQTRVGASLSNVLTFTPSLREIARAAMGDRTAQVNVGVAGLIGGGLADVGAKMQGQKGASLIDIAQGAIENMLFSKPTALGRRLGFQPSGVMPEGGEISVPKIEQPTTPDASLEISQAGPPDGGGVPQPEIAQGQAPIEEGGVRVQPGRPGEPLAQGAPEAAREVTVQPGAKIASTAIRLPGDKRHTGDVWNEGHQNLLKPATEIADPDGTGKGIDYKNDLGFEVINPDGTRAFADRWTAEALAMEQGLIPKGPPSAEGLTSEKLKGLVDPNALVATEPTPTSIKNAVVAEERAARGIPPAEEPARREFGEVWDAAKVEIAQNPTAPDALLAALRQKSRALTDRESAVILHRQIELQNAFDKTAAELNAAVDAGDETARADADTRLEGTREALAELYDIGKRAGTETGRGLAARKAMANADYTLARQETRLRADQGGVKLSAEQLKFVQEKVDTIAKTQAALDARLTEAQAKQQALEGLKTLEPAVRSVAERVIAKLDKTAAAAAKSLRSRLANLGAAPDPLILLDVAKIAAAKSAKGAIQFAQWSAEMIQAFGEKVRPYLQPGWDQRDQHVDATIGGEVTGKRTGVPKTEEAKAKQRKTYLANRTKDYFLRLVKGEYVAPKRKSLDLRDDTEYVQLKAENESAKKALDKAAHDARMKQRSIQQKVTDAVANTWAASRPLLASTDISAVGRQGIFFTLPDLFLNPKRLTRQMKGMFRSQFSERKYQENEASLKARENADIYESSDLYLADIDHKPSAREEQFKSELAEKIPGVGRVVRGSNRGFTAMMNTVRADAMDSFLSWSGGRDKVNPETQKYLAAAINDLSGRGNVTSRQAQGALEWLANYLFSPRLWVSRFNTAILKPIWRDPLNRAIQPRARAVVAGQYAKFVGALAALKFLAGMNGGEMEEDPRDSDFGKLQFGSKRYDVTGGIGNMITLLARIATRKTKDDKGKTLRIAWQDEKRPERELGQILFQHLRNKAAPIPGAIYDYIYGRHPDRTKVTPVSTLKQTTVPITVSDTLEYFRKDTPASALRDTIINALGVPVSDYRK